MIFCARNKRALTTMPPTSTPSELEGLGNAVGAFVKQCQGQVEIVQHKYNEPEAFEQTAPVLWDPGRNAYDIRDKRLKSGTDVTDEQWSRLKQQANDALVAWRDQQDEIYRTLCGLHARLGFERFWVPLGDRGRELDGFLYGLGIHMKSLKESSVSINHTCDCLDGRYDSMFP